MISGGSYIRHVTRWFAIVASVLLTLGLLTLLGSGVVTLICVDLVPLIFLAPLLVALVLACWMIRAILKARPKDLGVGEWGVLASFLGPLGLLVLGAIGVVVGHLADVSASGQLAQLEPWLWLGFVFMAGCSAVCIAVEFRPRMVRVFCIVSVVLTALGLAVIGPTGHDVQNLEAARTTSNELVSERGSLNTAITENNENAGKANEAVQKQAQRLLDHGAEGDTKRIAELSLNFVTAAEDDRPAVLDQIKALYVPTAATSELVDLRTALDKAKSATKLPQASGQTSQAIGDLCKIGGGQLNGGPEQPHCEKVTAPPALDLDLSECPAPQHDATKPVSLQLDFADTALTRRADVLEAIARCELESSKVALGTSKADNLTTAKHKVVDAVLALHERQPSVSILDDVSDGASQVLSTLSHSGNSPQTDLTILGWLVLAGALLLGYRWLEIQAGLHRVGPVNITFEGKDRETTEEGAHFREAVLRNIPEPGAVPGANALAPVSTLLGEVDAPQGKLVKALIELVQSVFATTSGYTINVSWRSEDAASSGNASTDSTPENGTAPALSTAAPTPKGGIDPKASDPSAATTTAPSQSAVFVRILDARTGRQLAISTLHAETAAKAAVKAGYWCAGWIISRSRDIPAWARWDESTADALALLDWEGAATARIDQLEQAVATAPTAGVLLVSLGYRYDLEDQFGRAMELYARTLRWHPRYFIGRYRASSSLAMIGSDYGRLWTPVNELTKKNIERYLGLGGNPTADALLAKALELTKEDEKLLGWWTVLWAALRRSERTYWLAFLTRDHREGTKLLAKSGQLLVLARRNATTTDEETTLRTSLGAAGNKTDTTHQVLYNLACYHTLRGELDDAIAWLSQALDHPFSDQLTREWLRADPDLERLRNERRDDFETIIKRALSEAQAPPPRRE
jgi:tetratricopeptide (TPR) repeat protein